MIARRPTAALAAVAVALALALGVADARAQALPGQVTGLAVKQQEGFATLSWTPIEGATQYQIVRTPVDELDVPTGPVQVVGLWQPNRTVTPDRPTFADAGFALGGRYQWRVSVVSPSPGPPSEPVSGTTRPQWGSGPGAGLRTQWETSGNATYTSDVNEYAYTAALDAASDRVRVVEVGRTNPVATAPTGRPINMLVIGYPAPPGTAEEISDSPAIVYNCNVHGNEPQGRESCLIFARMLAFTEDEHLLEVLSGITVLIVPTINGNGRAANTRGNETGQDLNRDHAGITQPETKAFAAMLRDYTPEVGIDLHEGDTEDLPILSARHLNVHEPLFVEGKSGLVEGWMYDHAAVDGWWAGPYSNGGDSHEGILRNTFGLKNVVGMLAESRPDGGTTRPGEATQLANRNRKSYASLWEEFQMLEYYAQRRARIHELVEQAIAFNRANVGRVVLRGAYPWPAFPGPGGPPLPDTDAPTASRIIDPPPCGYFLTETQYSGTRSGGTVALRFGLHGIAVDDRPAGHIVRLAQPLRGLIPTLLDANAVSPEPIVAGTRLFDCPHVTASPRSFAVSAVIGGETAATLAIGNAAVGVEEDLEWTLAETTSGCGSPGELDWFGADPAAGITTAGSRADVLLRFSAAGFTGPAARSGVLCLASNDAGEPEIGLPLELLVIYDWDGFLSPISNDRLNATGSGTTVPVKFSLGGDFGLGVFEAGYPQSAPISCATGEETGSASPTASSTGLTFADGRYHYNWRTEASWSGTCRALVVKLNDGTAHRATFQFR
jgi:hypothetical protein